MTNVIRMVPDLIEPDLIEKGKVVPVAVPRYDKKAQAIVRAAGAYQHGEPLPWFVINAKADLTSVKRWLPRKFRPGLDGMPLEPKMIPAKQFGVNLRAILGAQKWSELSQEVGRRCGGICQVCGQRPIGPNGEWQLHCHEDWKWEHDHYTGMQRLNALACICTKCHQAIHFGRAMTDGDGREALMHLMKVNSITSHEAHTMLDLAWQEINRLNEVPEWTMDLSYLLRHFGIPLIVTSLEMYELRAQYADEQGRFNLEDGKRHAAIQQGMRALEKAERPELVN